MIDWERVTELRDEVGEDDFGEVVEIFLEEVDEVIERLRRAPEPELIEADMHFVKGSALNLGFSELATLSAEGERLAASGTPEKADLAGVIASYEASKAEFETGLHRGRAAA